jgi:hypothetical protein
MKTVAQTARKVGGIVLATAALLFAVTAQADPPVRAARLGYIEGPVSFSPAGDDSWVVARLNRPITVGDSLWTDNDGRLGHGCHLRARESAGPVSTPYPRRGAGDSASFQTSLLMTPMFAFSSDWKSGRHCPARGPRYSPHALCGS